MPSSVEYENSLLVTRPWEKHLFGGPENVLIVAGGTGDKEKAAKNFALWLQTCHPLDLIVYTDGSQEVNQDGEKAMAGAGWVVEWADKWFYLNGCSLGKGVEVYDAEATAIVYGLQAALNSPMAQVAPWIHLCLDNLSVARAAGKITKGSSQKLFKQFRDTAKMWMDGGGKMTVNWIPSHSSIEGNEIADREAKKYANQKLEGAPEAKTLAHAKRTIKRHKYSA